MAITPRLDLRQSQSLVMTPQLQQAIKLLQLTNLELITYVEQELEQNPLLERDEGEGDAEGPDTAPEDGSEGAAEVEVETDALESIDFSAESQTPLSENADLDVDYDNVWNADSPGDTAAGGPADGAGSSMGDPAFSDWGSRGGRGFDNGEFSIEQTLTSTISLRDHLVGQLNISLTDTVDRMIGLHIIDMLNEFGYLTGGLSQISQNLNCGDDRVAAVLSELQQFDPPGIFARDLAECLAIQLKDLDRLDPAMQIFLENLDLLAQQDFQALASKCGVDGDDLADMINEIRELDPKPALAFDVETAQTIIPDVIMRARSGGGWSIELNNDTLPRVLVNNRYYAEITLQTKNKDDQQYINDCLQSANWLVKALHQRATTILRVATEIVRQQDDFFVKGVEYLRPLVLRDISEAIDMHESTVSRVTSNKFITTPRGIFELKYFFSPSINSSVGGDAHSAEAVRHRVRALIQTEAETGRVLSDDQIVDILVKDGVGVARRTVAKYRESMRIPSSVQRRRVLANQS